MRIVVAGTGNIASHFSRAFIHSGLEISGVVGRDTKKAADFAASLGSIVIDPFEISPASADLIFIAVSDDSISSVSEMFPREIAQVHTSGTISLNMLVSNEKGVIYPVQTFTKDRPVKMSTVPLCIEASSPEMLKKLSALAELIAGQVTVMDSENRKWLHLAAVFANNFTNHFYNVASELLQEHNLSFDLLRPLIVETSNKITDTSPDQVQTGPAKRGNRLVLEQHAKMLAEKPELQNLYRYVSELIIKQHSKNLE